MEGRKRHLITWELFKIPTRILTWIRFNFHPEKHPIPSPSLIVANHVTDWDPIMLGHVIRNQAYFVASEHALHGFALKLINWLQAPIIRLKGTTASDTAMTMLRRLKKGCNVVVFAEGNRSFNGQTGEIIESTAKMARSSGATLVTVKFTGGYLSTPRWAGDKVRRGRIDGRVVHEYSPETLKAMKPAEIADIIRADIYENAFETQRKLMIPYRGKNKAEHLERALHICPVCGAGGLLQSQGDTISCACGMRAVYNEYGFFESETLPFDNVLDWDKWQAERILTWIQNSGDACLASDDNVRLACLSDDNVTTKTGTIRVFSNRLEVAGHSFGFGEITGMAVSGPQSLNLSVGETHWFVSSGEIRNLRKYLTFYRAATDPEHILAV